mmetsp:Transcript_43707/g.103189  ORF Transcript_43707/g.103189 Transcript_43707/m.103189 type:complete len:412 (-) Transcript_43707:190-1425(-)
MSGHCVASVSTAMTMPTEMLHRNHQRQKREGSTELQYCGHAPAGPFPGTAPRCAAPGLGRTLLRKACRNEPKLAKSKRHTAKRVDQALCKLRTLIASSPAQHRREALEILPARLRIVLLQHMQAQKGSATAPQQVKVPATMPEAQRSSPKAKILTGGWHAVPRTASGVARKKGGYLVQVRLAPYISACSRCHESFADADRDYQVLLRARDFIHAKATQAIVEDKEAACEHNDHKTKSETSEVWDMMQALAEACRQGGCSVDDLRLTYCAVVPAHAVVGQSVSTGASTCLEDVLRQRNGLLLARSQGWNELRAAWVQMMVTPRQHREGAWGRCRFQILTMQQAEAVADAARKRHMEQNSLSQAAQSDRVWRQLRHKIETATRSLSTLLQDTSGTKQPQAGSRKEQTAGAERQ